MKFKDGDMKDILDLVGTAVEIENAENQMSGVMRMSDCLYP